jgi:hypothetical protein
MIGMEISNTGIAGMTMQYVSCLVGVPNFDQAG